METKIKIDDKNLIINDILEDCTVFRCECFGEMFRYLNRKLFKKAPSTPKLNRAELDNRITENNAASSTNYQPNLINRKTEVVVSDCSKIVFRDVVITSSDSEQPSIDRQNDFTELAGNNISEMPKEIQNDLENMKKYWINRYRLFSKYDKGIKLDPEMWYSVTPEKISIEIAKRCRCDVIAEPFCGAGGNAIQFAFVCEKVIAIDIDPERIKLAKHNAEIYGVADRIEFIVGDFFHLAPSLTADVVFLSPPWGGPSWANFRDYPLGRIMQPYGGQHVYHVAKQISKRIAYLLPRNILLTEVAVLEPDDYIRIDRNYFGDELFCLTVYFGDLVEDDGATNGAI